MKKNSTFVSWLAVVLTLTLGTAHAAPLVDTHAGFSLNLEDSQSWVSQLTNTPGITSKLCLTRAAPRLLLCLQSLHQPIKADEVPDLARGFVDAITERFGVAAPAELATQSFSELSGYMHWFQLSPSVAPEGLADVWLFAGTGPAGQPQMIIAFSSPTERELATVKVAAALNAVHYGTNGF